MSPDLDLSGVPAAARTQIHTAQAAERQGRTEEARRCFETALHALRGPEHAVLAGSLFRWIGWAHANEGDAEAALDCLQVAEVVAEAAGDDHGLASALNSRAGTLFNLGKLDEAEALFRRVQKLARRIGDRELRAMADQNLGSVASIRGDLWLALRCFRSSLAGYQELGLGHHIGPLLSNIGLLQTELGEDAEAERTLASARQLCLEQGDLHHQIVVEVNRARLMLQSGQVVPALTVCSETLELSESTGDHRWVAEVHLVTGTAHARLGNWELALGALESAAQLARDRRDAKVLADVVLEQAGVLRELGRNRETLQKLNEAHGIFRQLRARRELADVDTRLAALEEVFLEIVSGWGASIESKDAYTHGHSARVANVACQLATASGLPNSELIWFRMGALLHDVGKVEVPEEVLKKPGPLDEDEWRLMALHPVAGVQLLEGIEFPWDIRPMIRHHHERWDGTGYPDRLQGEGIPSSARLLTIADVYDALTSDRPYRPGFTHEGALAIMESEQARTLDPTLFTLFRRRVAPQLARHPLRIEPATAATGSRRVRRHSPSPASPDVVAAL